MYSEYFPFRWGLPKKIFSEYFLQKLTPMIKGPLAFDGGSCRLCQVHVPGWDQPQNPKSAGKMCRLTRPRNRSLTGEEPGQRGISCLSSEQRPANEPRWKMGPAPVSLIRLWRIPGPCRECVRGLTLLLRHFCLCLSLHRSYWIINTNSAAFTFHFCMTVLLQSCLCINWCSSGRTYFCRDSSSQHVTLLRTPWGN